MTYEQAMDALQRAGTEQNRKVYARHGAKEPMFGVSWAALGKLVKQIKRDQDLAQKLWASGNYDARILATMIADPQAIDSKTLDRWARELDSDPLAGALAKLAAASPHAETLMPRWKDSPDECISVAGWTIIAILATGAAPTSLSDPFFAERLNEIERTITSAKNRTKYAMNNALIAIGGHRSALTDEALAAARRIGKVEVDHGQTGCRTPDAAEYIQKMLKRTKAASSRGAASPNRNSQIGNRRSAK